MMSGVWSLHYFLNQWVRLVHMVIISKNKESSLDFEQTKITYHSENIAHTVQKSLFHWLICTMSIVQSFKKIHTQFEGVCQNCLIFYQLKDLVGLAYLVTARKHISVVLFVICYKWNISASLLLSFVRLILKYR